MHTSKNIDVYLSIPSNPIIEHSSAIRFAAYPTSLSLSAPTSVRFPSTFPYTPSKTNSQDKYTSVQDFSHIRSTQSPNWSIMPDDARRDDWLGLDVQEGGDIKKLLDELLPAMS
jgi:hypothetical protein